MKRLLSTRTICSQYVLCYPSNNSNNTLHNIIWRSVNDYILSVWAYVSRRRLYNIRAGREMRADDFNKGQRLVWHLVIIYARVWYFRLASIIWYRDTNERVNWNKWHMLIRFSRDQHKHNIRSRSDRCSRRRCTRSEQRTRKYVWKKYYSRNRYVLCENRKFFTYSFLRKIRFFFSVSNRQYTIRFDSTRAHVHHIYIRIFARFSEFFFILGVL